MNGRKRGFAMTYAVVLFLIVSLFISILLLNAQLTVESSSDYINYIDDKNLLDEAGAAAIADYTVGNADGKWIAEYESEDLTVDVDFTDDKVRVIVVLCLSKELYMEFGKDVGGKYILTAYVYNFTD